MSSAQWGLFLGTFTASLVEFVEAFTIVLAMGMTRGWRSALAGTAAALVALILFTAAAGYALRTWLPASLLQLVVGTLLLLFGLQWLRKAILRSAGLKALHDEQAEFLQQVEAVRTAPTRRLGVDWLPAVIAFKGVFLEGVEVVFIVITFGWGVGDMTVAVIGAALAGLIVLLAGLIARRPLSRVPENTLKYGVGLLLATFGTYWAVEGIGALTPHGDSVAWPGADLALPVILLGWLALSRLLIHTLPRLGTNRTNTKIEPALKEGTP